MIETSRNSCQLRWVDAATSSDEKLADPRGRWKSAKRFLQRVREGRLGAKAAQAYDGPLSVDFLREVLRKTDRRLPPDPTPLETAAAYLSLDPERQDPTALLTSLLIMLGPPLQASVGERIAATTVDFLVVEITSILERLRSSSPERRSLKYDGMELTDESARGCFELTIRDPAREQPIIVMVKTPRALGRLRCRE